MQDVLGLPRETQLIIASKNIIKGIAAFENKKMELEELAESRPKRNT